MPHPTNKSTVPGRYHGVPPPMDRGSLGMNSASYYSPPSPSLRDSPSVPRSVGSLSTMSVTPSMSPSNGGRSISGISDSMSNLTIFDPGAPAGASPTAEFKPKLIWRFQEAAIFLDALYAILRQEHIRRPHETTFTKTSNLEDAFHSFLNRIAELLDSRPKGKTVTAVLVQNNYDTYVYWIASNERTQSQINATAQFLKVLLTKVAELKSVGDDDRKSRLENIFKDILRFNRVKLTCYMNSFSKALEEVLASMQATRRASQDLLSILRLLSQSNNIAKPKTGEDEIQYLDRTEKLLSDLSSHTNLEVLIATTVQDTTADGVKIWCEIKHLIGRLLHYRRALDVVVNAYDYWPELFTNFSVHPVPSPKPEENPLKRKPTSHEIIGRMTSDKNEMEKYRALAGRLMNVNDGLDNAIKDRCVEGKYNPKPILHSEILLFDAFWRCQAAENREFFNGWKLLGLSKGTCLLCHYFFLGHVSGVKVRNTHGNFYLRWRFPYPIPRENSRAAFTEACHKMVNGVLNHVRERVFRTLESGERTGRGHDSNTNMTPWGRQRAASVAPVQGSSISTTLSFSSSSEYLDADIVHADDDIEAWMSEPGCEELEDSGDWHSLDGHDNYTTQQQEAVLTDGRAAAWTSIEVDDDDDEGGGVGLE